MLAKIGASWVLIWALVAPFPRFVSTARAEPKAAVAPARVTAAPNCSPLSLNEARLEARKLLESAASTRSARARLGYFEAAYRLYQDPVILYNMGSLMFDEGKKQEGADLLRRYLYEAGDAVPGARRDKLARLIGKVRGPTAELSLIGEPCAFVYVDHRLVGRVPFSLPLWLRPGNHKIDVEMDHRKARQEVRLSPGPSTLAVPLPSSVVLLTDLPRAHGHRLQQAATDGAQGAGLTVIGERAREAILTRSPELRGCLGDQDCQEELAHQLDAQYVVRARAEEADGSYGLSATLLDVGAGAVSVTRTARCAECSEEQAAVQLGQLLSDVLRGGLERVKGMLEITSVPEADVIVDGRRVGRTPFLRAQLGGRHEVVLRAVGYEEHAAVVDIAEGQKAALDVRMKVTGSRNLAPIARPEPLLPEPEAGRRPRWRLIAGGVGVAVGVGLLSLGASALSIDGQCGPSGQPADPVAPARACDLSYHSLGAGAAMLTGGIAVVLAGTVTMLWPGRPARPKVAALLPGWRPSR